MLSFNFISFSAQEIATRLRIAGAKAVVTQDVIYRSDKHIPLYERVLQAQEYVDHSYSIITIPAGSSCYRCTC